MVVMWSWFVGLCVTVCVCAADRDRPVGREALQLCSSQRGAVALVSLRGSRRAALGAGERLSSARRVEAVSPRWPCAPLRGQPCVESHLGFSSWHGRTGSLFLRAHLMGRRRAAFPLHWNENLLIETLTFKKIYKIRIKRSRSHEVVF